MSDDFDVIDDFVSKVADRYTATEIVEILGLTEWDILEMFRDMVLERRKDFQL